MRIVIAPDKFRGTLTAAEAANAIALGTRDAAPGAEVVTAPVADGGEGTGSVLLAALGGTVERHRVTGPVGCYVDGEVVRLNDGTVIVEMAAASGLHLLPPARRDALRASSLGTGELVSLALTAPDTAEIVVAVGGSASTDGGTGAAAALGWSFVDAAGHLLDFGGGALRKLSRIVPPERGDIGEVTIAGACDVEAPLTGEGGAARLFGPQKGASATEVEILEEALENLAERIRVDLAIDVASVPRAGAGGGMGAGLLAFFGASLESGFDFVARRIGLPARIAGADLVITGEGRLDVSSLTGKSAIGVARICTAHGVDCAVIAGEIVLDAAELDGARFVQAVGLADLYGRDAAVANAREALRRGAGELVASVLR